MLSFWIIKILCTTVGETAADFLNFNLHIGLSGATLVMSVLLTISLFFQILSKNYKPTLYWVTVVLVSVVGTLLTDNLTDYFGVSLVTSSIVFSLLLIGIFALWYKREKTLSMHSINTRSRELYYWSAILCTFALGTAVGDLIAETFQLGYPLSGVLFACALGIVTFLYKKQKLDSVCVFWIAYILTRPLGASIGDYLSQPTSVGGLGLGTTITSMVFLLSITGFVIYTIVYAKFSKK